MKTNPSKVTVRRSAERGHASHGWLESNHSSAETALKSGDALSTESPGLIEFTATEDAEALLFDLA